MRRQRLLLARRFDEELSKDTESDVSSTDLVSYVKTSEEEQDSQLDVMKLVEGHADPGLTLEEAKEYLHIPVDAPFPRIPGMKLSKRFLKDHQIEGIAWAVKKLLSLKGCIVADSMGLGKTCQGGCAYFVLARRQINSSETTRKPTLVVCPADLVQEWERELKELLPSDFIIYIYDSSSKDGILENDSEIFSGDDQASKAIVLSTYGVMYRRHGRRKFLADPRQPELYRDWRYCLQDQFSLLIMDEAHNIKGGPKSAGWVTITELQTDMMLAITGTPVPNAPADVMGIVSAVVKQASLERLNYQGTVNPYNYTDNPDILLQYHVNAIYDHIGKKKDPALQGALLKEKGFGTSSSHAGTPR